MAAHDSEMYDRAQTWKSFWATRGGVGGQDRSTERGCPECGRALAILICAHYPMMSIVCHDCQLRFGTFRLERGDASEVV